MLFSSSFMIAESLKVAKISNVPDHILGAKLLSDIYKRADIELELIELPGARSLLESSNGNVDGELQRIHALGDFYPSLVRVPTPFTYFEPAVFTKHFNLPIGGWSSLEGHEIGMVRGMKFAELGLNGFKQVFVLDDDNVMFNMLKRDRLDVIVTARFNGLYKMKDHPESGIYQLEPVIERHDLYHYLHVKNKHLVSKLDDVIKEMKKTGELKVLRARYVDELLK